MAKWGSQNVIYISEGLIVRNFLWGISLDPMQAFQLKLMLPRSQFASVPLNSPDNPDHVCPVKHVYPPVRSCVFLMHACPPFLSWALNHKIVFSQWKPLNGVLILLQIFSNGMYTGYSISFISITFQTFPKC